MALDILKKGLKVLENHIKAKKEILQAQLAKRKPISQDLQNNKLIAVFIYVGT